MRCPNCGVLIEELKADWWCPKCKHYFAKNFITKGSSLISELGERQKQFPVGSTVEILFLHGMASLNDVGIIMDPGVTIDVFDPSSPFKVAVEITSCIQSDKHLHWVSVYPLNQIKVVPPIRQIETSKEIPELSRMDALRKELEDLK
jgi:hypothetical protein